MFQALDIKLFELINMSAHNSVFDAVMPFFSQSWLMWAGAFVLIVAYAVHCCRSSLEPVGRVCMLILLVGLSVGVCDLATSGLKHSIGRERPCQTIVGANFCVPETGEWIVITEDSQAGQTMGGSMPSPPAAACMSLAIVLSMLFYRSNPWVFLLPFCVGFSQVYLGRNFPFDIVVGWVIGIISVIAVWWCCHLIFARFSTHRRLKQNTAQKNKMSGRHVAGT